MLTKQISFKNFLIKKKYSIVKKNLNSILSEKTYGFWLILEKKYDKKPSQIQF